MEQAEPRGDRQLRLVPELRHPGPLEGRGLAVRGGGPAQLPRRGVESGRRYGRQVSPAPTGIEPHPASTTHLIQGVAWQQPSVAYGVVRGSAHSSLVDVEAGVEPLDLLVGERRRHAAQTARGGLVAGHRNFDGGSRIPPRALPYGTSTAVSADMKAVRHTRMRLRGPGDEGVQHDAQPMLFGCLARELDATAQVPGHRRRPS